LATHTIVRREIALEDERRRVGGFGLASNDGGEQTIARLRPKLEGWTAIRRPGAELVIGYVNDCQHGRKSNHGEL
jgi:hypothetical protein